MDFHFYTHDELAELLQHATLKQLHTTLQSLSPSQLTTCVMLLDHQHMPDRFDKLTSLLDFFDEPNHLESIGKGLSSRQFLLLILHFSQNPHLQKKLSPLLVGLSPSVFIQSLQEMSPESLKSLKQESMTEPLQHQLTLFIHDCERLLEDTHLAVLNYLRMIQDLQTSHLSFEELENIESQIQQLKQNHHNRLEAINQAQAILWNANRIDLIDKLSHLKESLLFQLFNQIGHPSSDQTATGLFQALEERLTQTFTSTSSSLEKDESLQDDDSALEGLAKFSIWYLKDYWELGLLPSVKHLSQLELDPAKHDEQEWLNHRQQLFSLVQENLNRLKIGKVKDLKNARIFSRLLLERYIDTHRHCLTKKLHTETH